MTNKQEKAEKYLLDIRNMDREIEELINKIDYLRYKASGSTGIRYDKDHVQTSPEDMVCEAITEAISIENRLYARHRELMERIEHTKQVISLWNDNNAKMIEIYYLNHGSMGDVARQCRCSGRNAYKIRDKAVREFTKHL